MQFIIRKCSEGKEQCLMVAKKHAEIMVERAGWNYTTKDKFEEVNKKIGVEAPVRSK